MMARIRSVHPSLFTDEAWVSCTPLARLLYIGLWTEADDQGVFEWRPATLKMRILPLDNVAVPELLDELTASGLIRRYAVAERDFGAIGSFQKHQRPQKPRTVWPVTPEIAEYLTGQQPSLFADEYDTSPRISQPRKGEDRKGGGGERTRVARKPETPIPDGFPGQDELEMAKIMVAESGQKVDVAWEAKKIRTWAEQNGKTYRDWRACWRGWIERAIKYAEERNGAKVVEMASAPISEERQRAWMQDFLDAPHQWRPYDRGPRPDEPNCRITAKIMAEFGYEPPRRARA